jgi:GNAT superfamily N-acetyltransferase
MMEMSISQASPSDVPAIVRLVNNAFEVERFFKDDTRTNPDEINGLLQKGTFFLLNERGQLAGCIYVQTRGQRGYIGLLSVDPARQGAGLGSLLMQHAEGWCARAGCSGVDLRIVHLRAELLAFYGKRGYIERGTEPGDVVKGARQPVHFVWMSKELTGKAE